jgi:hypothetical protein
MELWKRGSGGDFRSKDLPAQARNMPERINDRLTEIGVAGLGAQILALGSGKPW